MNRKTGYGGGSRGVVAAAAIVVRGLLKGPTKQLVIFSNYT
jgi:hypothetical protein